MLNSCMLHFSMTIDNEDVYRHNYYIYERNLQLNIHDNHFHMENLKIFAIFHLSKNN